MWEDPIVAEVHRTRAEILAEFGGDFGKYIDYLRKREQEHPERLISAEELKRRARIPDEQTQS